MKHLTKGATLMLLLATLMACTQRETLRWIPFNWESDTISGQYLEKAYIYIPVTIEGIPHEFTMQFDLGTYHTLVYGNTIDPYLEKYPAFARKIDPSRAWYRNVTLKMGKETFDNVDLLYAKNFGDTISADSIRTPTPKHIGTIAPDLFKDKVLIIDYPSARLAVADSLPDEYKDLPAEEFQQTDGIIKLPFNINGNNQTLLFDTGSSPFSLVTSRERALEIADPHITDSLSGPLWWGKQITFYSLEVNKPVTFGGKPLRTTRVYYDKEGLWESVYTKFNVWGITGNAYFFDKTVIIDYKNNLFRIK